MALTPMVVWFPYSLGHSADHSRTYELRASFEVRTRTGSSFALHYSVSVAMCALFQWGTTVD